MSWVTPARHKFTSAQLSGHTGRAVTRSHPPLTRPSSRPCPGAIILDLVLTILALSLVATVLACLVFVLRARTDAERLLGAVLAGTTSAAVLAMASVLLDEPALRNAALVVVALAALVVLGLVAGRRGTT